MGFYIYVKGFYNCKILGIDSFYRGYNDYLQGYYLNTYPYISYINFDFFTEYIYNYNNYYYIIKG